MKTMTAAERTAIATWIKQARERAGLSQAALANRLGTSTASVGLWEIGPAKPAAKRLPLIAEVLGVTASWLTDESGSEREAVSQPQDEHGVPVLLKASPRGQRDVIIGAIDVLWLGV
jgi:transcriptional regulator with XRE-family HTH domain